LPQSWVGGEVITKNYTHPSRLSDGTESGRVLFSFGQSTLVKKLLFYALRLFFFLAEHLLNKYEAKQM
jgi:hypothetical protein